MHTVKKYVFLGRMPDRVIRQIQTSPATNKQTKIIRAPHVAERLSASALRAYGLGIYPEPVLSVIVHEQFQHAGFRGFEVVLEFYRCKPFKIA